MVDGYAQRYKDPLQDGDPRKRARMAGGRHGRVATLEGFLNRRLATLLLDSGADNNYLSKALAEELGARVVDRGAVLEIDGAGGGVLYSHGTATITTTVGAAQSDLTFQVVEDEDARLPFVIIGEPTLHDIDARFGRDGEGAASLSVAGQTCYYDSERRLFRPVAIDLEMVEPPIDELEPLSLEINFSEMHDAFGNVTDMVAPPRVPLVVVKGEVNVTLQKETTVDDIPDDINIVGSPDTETVAQMNAQLKARFNSVQKDLVELSLLKLESARAPPEYQMGEQYLKLRTWDPKFPRDGLIERQRRHGQVNESVLERYIAEGLKSGMLEEADPEVLNAQEVRCTTNHCFPVSGRGALAKVRVSIVAQLLNQWTVAVGIFRLVIDEVKQRVDPRQCEFMTVIDIRWAFNLIEIAKEMRPRTTFYGLGGRLYWYARMPFGLKNAPACWQAFVAKLLSHLGNVIVFVDDLFLFSRTVEEHVALLEKVVAIFKEHHIPVRWQKIQLARRTVHFLGAVWERGGVIRPNTESLETVERFPVPRGRKELKSFLGVCRWLGNYVAELERHLSPFRPLVREGAPFVWTAEHQTAFEQAKAAVRGHMSVHIPDYAEGAPGLKVMTDASDWGFGAVLSQGQHLLALYSHSWNDREMKWGTITQEAYAVYATLTHWRDWLYGVHFELETDHRPLVHILYGLADGKGSKMVNRWFTFLLQFDVTIRHIAGEQNVMADYLSRMSTGSEGQVRAFLRCKAPELTGNDADVPEMAHALGADGTLSILRAAECPFCSESTNGDVSIAETGEEETPRYTSATLLWMKVQEALETDVGYRALRAVAEEGADPLAWGPENPYHAHRQAVHDNRERYYVDRDRLWYHGEGDREGLYSEPELVVPESQQPYLYKELHSSALAGHGGVAVTKERFRRYHWPGKADDIARWIANCDRCQRAKVGPTANVKRRPLPPTGAWERVHVDLIDMTKYPSKEEHTFILVVRDSFTRFMFARALKNKRAETVAWKLFKLFGETGQPTTVFVDDGSEFANAINQELHNQCAAMMMTSPTLVKSSNGTVERANRIVHQYLRLVKARHRWNRYLSFVCHANNSAVCTATGYPPCVLFYGRRFIFSREFQAIRHKVAHLKDSEWDATPPRQSDDLDLDTWLDGLDDHREAARARDAHQKEMEKRRFEKRTRAERVPRIAKGMRVLVRADPSAAGHKEEDLYEGPDGGYVVVDADEDGLNVKIDDEGRHRIVHASNLRLYKTRPITDPIVADDVADGVAHDERHTLVEAVEAAADDPAIMSAPASPRQASGEEPEEPPSVDSPVTTLPRNMYTVETLLAARGHVGRNRIYRVAWEGFPIDERSDVYEDDIDPDGPLAALVSEWKADLAKERWHYREGARLEPEEILRIESIGSERSRHRGKTSRHVDAIVTVALQHSLPDGALTKVPIASLSDRIFVAERHHLFADKDVRQLVTAAYDRMKEEIAAGDR